MRLVKVLGNFCGARCPFAVGADSISARFVAELVYFVGANSVRPCGCGIGLSVVKGCTSPVGANCVRPCGRDIGLGADAVRLHDVSLPLSGNGVERINAQMDE